MSLTLETPKIFVICKYNQARSIIAAAAIRRFFPECQVISGGIFAKTGSAIPMSILGIIEEWDLPEIDHASRNITDLPPMSAKDFVLCADQEVADYFRKHFLKIAVETRVSVLKDFAFDPKEIPSDPVDMSQDATKLQLARAVLLATRAVSQHFGLSDLNLNYQSDLNVLKSLLNKSNILKANKPILIIDTMYSIPDSKKWAPYSELVCEFDLRNLDLEIPENKLILVNRFESDRVSKICLSTNYQKWLQDLSKKYEIHLFAGIKSDLVGARDFESVIALVHS